MEKDQLAGVTFNLNNFSSVHNKFHLETNTVNWEL